jgi:hypothetical protein
MLFQMNCIVNRPSAITLLYQFYFDVIRGEECVWKVEEKHKKYGKMVRVVRHSRGWIVKSNYERYCISMALSAWTMYSAQQERDVINTSSRQMGLKFEGQQLGRFPTISTEVGALP